jgi:hypothetical protein
MPRYFLDLTNDDTVEDEVGEEFDLVKAARAGMLWRWPGNCRATNIRVPGLGSWNNADTWNNADGL